MGGVRPGAPRAPRHQHKRFRSARAARGLALGAAALLAVAPAVADDRVALPSGRSVSAHDVIRDAAGDAIRFRFLEADLADVVATTAYDALESDMRYLCENYALDRLADDGQPARIIISISDRPVEFGEPTPDATQVFEAYRPDDGACIWEGF